MEKNEKKHHFLYYIFHFDHKSCKMNEKRELCLLENIRQAIALNQKGE